MAVSTLELRGNAMVNRRKKLVKLADVKGLAADIDALRGTVDIIAETMARNGIREISFDGLLTINNAVNSLHASLAKMSSVVERSKPLR